ncbi:MAG: T9SS type A sorting domain-containing protein, partial [Bacteroidota bacterium]
IEFGVTTGVDVNGLLIQGGGAICAALDVAGAPFDVVNCDELVATCEAEVGSLFLNLVRCTSDDSDGLFRARIDDEPVVPEGFELIYVLTSGDNLVIEAVDDKASFPIDEVGFYTIHTLIYDPNTLDLGIVEFGKTTGFDVNSLLIQGGGEICGALDVTGVRAHVGECPCDADAGSLVPVLEECIPSAGTATIRAELDDSPVLPRTSRYYRIRYVLTKGDGLVIQDVSSDPEFEISTPGTYRIHTLVYNFNTLDLGIVEPGVTTGFDVNGLLIQGGGAICAALDVAGAKFEVTDCVSNLRTPQIYPNPAKNQLIIDVPSNFNQLEISIDIVDQTGNVMMTNKYPAGTKQAVMNIANISDGMYAVRFRYGKGQIKQALISKIGN